MWVVSAQETCPTYSYVPKEFVLVIPCIFTQNVSHVPLIHTYHVFGVSHVLHIHTKNMPHILTHTKNSKFHSYFTYSHRTWVVSHILKHTRFLVLLMSHIFTKELCPTYSQTPFVFFWDCCVSLQSGKWTLVRVTSHVFTQKMSDVPHTHTYTVISMSHVPHIPARYAACPIDPNTHFCVCNGIHE